MTTSEIRQKIVKADNGLVKAKRTRQLLHPIMGKQAWPRSWGKGVPASS